MTAMPMIAAQLSSSTPMASPGELNSFTGIESRSKYSGPGLLTFVFVLCDADVHVPSSGKCWLNTSRERNSKYALSPIGIQPRLSARTVALTNGTIVIATDARKMRLANGDGLRLSSDAGGGETFRSSPAARGAVACSTSVDVFTW